MNRFQKVIMSAGAVVLLALVLHPPYFGIDRESGGRLHAFIGHHWVWDPPAAPEVHRRLAGGDPAAVDAQRLAAFEARINTVRLLVSLLGLGAAVAAGMVLARSRTPSLRSRIVRLMLAQQNRCADRTASLAQRRAALESKARRLALPRGVMVQPVSAGGVPAEWLRPAGAPDGGAILYLHGGAYTMGSCATHRSLAARIALAAGIPALQPEFRLAPEHPFPAALRDCATAYRWLIDTGIASRRIAIAGDSSGGGLAIALAVMLRDEGARLPAAVVCLSPWADLALTGESLRTRADVDPLCSIEDSRFFAMCYVGDGDPRAPLVSPIHADLQGLPPLLIHAGDREILLSDATRLATRAREHGVEVELGVWQGMWHVWHLLAAWVPEGREAIDEIGAFIRRHAGH